MFDYVGLMGFFALLDMFQFGFAFVSAIIAAGYLYFLVWLMQFSFLLLGLCEPVECLLTAWKNCEWYSGPLIFGDKRKIHVVPFLNWPVIQKGIEI